MISPRWMPVVAAGLAIPLAAFHLVLKPRVKPEDAARIASMAARPGKWQGRVAPELEITTLNGEVFRLSDHVGREAVVLNFFTTWCGPCREEMPELARLMARNASRPVRFLAIDVEEKRTIVDAFVEDARVTLPIALDESGSVAKSFGVESYPTTVLVGADGRVLLHQSGAIRNADVSLRPVLEQALASLSRGEGISREAYLETARREVASTPARERPLSGRALQIAQEMDCPCGCSDKVAKCECRTAKAIKRRLAGAALGGRTDEEVMRELNREFCMKGM